MIVAISVLVAVVVLLILFVRGVNHVHRDLYSTKINLKNLSSYRFPDKVVAHLERTNNRLRSFDRIDIMILQDAFIEYADVVKANRDAVIKLPSQQMNMFWRLFMLHTDDYARFCNEYMGFDFKPVTRQNGNNHRRLKHFSTAYIGMLNRKYTTPVFKSGSAGILSYGSFYSLMEFSPYAIPLLKTCKSQIPVKNQVEPASRLRLVTH